MNAKSPAARVGRRVLLVWSGLVGVLTYVRALVGDPVDAFTYWTFRIGPDLYAVPVNHRGAHEYAPVFAHVLAPFTALPWEAFFVLWTGWHLALLLVIVGPRWFGLVLMLPITQWAITNGNIHLELAAVAAFGLRYPAVWAVALLTKITPGVGLLWFALRREWRNLTVALGVTVALVLASMILAPGAWLDWFGYLWANREPRPLAGYLDVPLWLRLGLAVALVTWGALRDKPWVIPAVVWVAQPYAWWPALVILLAWLPRLTVAYELRKRARERSEPDRGDVRGNVVGVVEHVARA